MIRLLSNFARDEDGMQVMEVVLLIFLAGVVTFGVIGLTRTIINYAGSFINVAIHS